jgi:hypothetical protein
VHELELLVRGGAESVELEGDLLGLDRRVEIVYASDRLHLNARGHAIVGTEAVRVLSSAVVARTRNGTRAPAPVTIELTEEEILEDLFWPHPPPASSGLSSPGEPR